MEKSLHIPPAPLFRDPIHDGAADPTIIWNRQEKSWWIFYTNRRANVDAPGVAWAHGTDIGIASSGDGGRSWRYRGIAEGLHFERGRNSYWAPELFWHEDRYHMFVSYVPGVPEAWIGERLMLHYTSDNLWDWRFAEQVELSSRRVIDACVYRLPNGTWRMWYKDEANHSHTYAADSDTLYDWHVVGPIITDCAHEGPNVFHWQGFYWMVTDPWKGQAVYRSEDCANWVRQENILDRPGQRADDGAIARHADVLVQGDKAYIFYFTHPGENLENKAIIPNVMPYSYRRTSLQVAQLTVEDGHLRCDRDAAFDFVLAAGE